MVYKPLKDQTNLVLPRGKREKKNIQAFFVLKTSQVLIGISLFAFFLIWNNTLYLYKHVSPSSREYCTDII